MADIPWTDADTADLKRYDATTPTWHLERRQAVLMGRAAAEIDRLLGEIHTCPVCGAACKQCSCWEKEMEELRAERDRLQSDLEYAGTAVEGVIAWLLEMVDDQSMYDDASPSERARLLAEHVAKRWEEERAERDRLERQLAAVTTQRDDIDRMKSMIEDNFLEAFEDDRPGDGQGFGWTIREMQDRAWHEAKRELAAEREKARQLAATLKWYADHHEALLSKAASVAIPNYAKQTLEEVDHG